MLSIQVTWKCDHCQKIVFKGEQFKANYARVHLAAAKKNGLCANLCTADDEGAEKRREYFRKKIADLQKAKAETSRKRKQQAQRLAERELGAVADVVNKKKKAKKSGKYQPKLVPFLKEHDAAAADFAVAQWAIAHDIAPNAMKGPYWKNVNKKLMHVSPLYTPMYDRKMYEKMLPKLRQMAAQEVSQHLKYRPQIGCTLTGDGATKGVPLINFLVHVPGRGVKLMSIVDCSAHLTEGGVKDAMYVLSQHCLAPP